MLDAVGADLLRSIAAWTPTTDLGCLAGTCRAAREVLPGPYTTDPYASLERFCWSGIATRDVCVRSMGLGGSIPVIQRYINNRRFRVKWTAPWDMNALHGIASGAAEAHHVPVLNLLMPPDLDYRLKRVAGQMGFCIPEIAFHVVHGAVRGGHIDIVGDMQKRFQVLTESCNSFHVSIVNSALHHARVDMVMWLLAVSGKDLRLLADSIIPFGDVSIFKAALWSLAHPTMHNFMREYQDFFTYACAEFQDRPRELMIRHLQKLGYLPGSVEELKESCVIMHTFFSNEGFPGISDVNLDDVLAWLDATFGADAAPLGP